MTHFKHLLLTLFIAYMSFFINDAFADKGGIPHGGGGMGKGNSSHFSHSNYGLALGKNKPNKVKFSKSDKAEISKYFQANPVKGSTLPPGIAKNVARGKPIPPGIQKVFLPSDVTSSLPKFPGYEYRAVGDDVVLVNSNTGVVSDILPNLLSR